MFIKEATSYNNSKSVVHFLLVNFGWWVTILGLVGDQLASSC